MEEILTQFLNSGPVGIIVATAYSGFTGTGIYIRYPVNQIWGINSKY